MSLYCLRMVLFHNAQVLRKVFIRSQFKRYHFSVNINLSFLTVFYLRQSWITRSFFPIHLCDSFSDRFSSTKWVIARPITFWIARSFPPSLFTSCIPSLSVFASVIQLKAKLGVKIVVSGRAFWLTKKRCQRLFQQLNKGLARWWKEGMGVPSLEPLREMSAGDGHFSAIIEMIAGANPLKGWKT